MTVSPPWTLATLIDRRYSCRTYLDAADLGRATVRRSRRSWRTGRGGRSASPSASASSPRPPDDEGALRRLGTYGFIKGATRLHRRRGAQGPGRPRGLRLPARGGRPGGHRDRSGHLLAGRDVHAQHASRRASAASAATRPSPPSSPPATRETTAPSASASASRATRQVPARRALLRRTSWASRSGAQADGYGEALEAVRMAPSATNKQPWRIVRRGATGTSTSSAPRATARAARGSSCCASPTCSAWTWASPCATSSWSRGRGGLRRRLERRRPGRRAAGPGHRVHGHLARARPSGSALRSGRRREAPEAASRSRYAIRRSSPFASPKLLEQPEPVGDAPVLDRLAGREAEHVDHVDLDLLAGGRPAHERPVFLAVTRERSHTVSSPATTASTSNVISLSDWCRPRTISFTASGPMPWSAVLMLDEVAGDELVDHGEVAVPEGLLEQTARGGDVVFHGHARPPDVVRASVR